MSNNESRILETLKKSFGWDELKPGQLQVVSRLLDGISTVAVFPTGGGKSLCYQLPALLLEGLTVVVSPLIALMKDQIDQLQSKGICAVRLDSSLTHEEYRDAIGKVRGGQAKLLYVAPERFFNERFRGELERVNISLFAIDEAHCISQWGHNFRPDYLKLRNITERFDVSRVLCLTATATPAVQEDICQAFDIAQDDVICTPFFRPNLHIKSSVVKANQRDSVLIDKLKSRDPGATIVYVTLQKTAERVAKLCQDSGLQTRAYHAGMDPETRAKIQDWFMQDGSRIVVATIAFGMGIDKSDIRYVYHYNPAKSIESYAQEIGRAGRDGKVSCCESLLVPEDRVVLENFVFGDTPSLPSIESFIAEIARQPDSFFVSPFRIGNQADIRGIVVKTLLTYLELDGYLESTSPRYESYRFKPNVSSAQLLANFEGERQQFVADLLRCATKQRVWFSIDLADAMERLGCDRMKVVKALDYFGEQGWIELKVSGLVHGYRKLNSIDSVTDLAKHYFDKVVSREQNEIQRTRQFIDLMAAEECQAATMSAHFGQPLQQACGECSFCQGQGPVEISEPRNEKLTASTLNLVEKLTAEHPAALNTPRAVARFLCGITSPALTRAKLSRHAAFGSCQLTPFDEVMKQVAELNCVAHSTGN